MNKQDNETKLTIEDRIKNVSAYVGEINGFCNVLYASLGNESDLPTISDLEKSVYILMEYVKNASNEVDSLIELCENNGIFNNKP